MLLSPPGTDGMVASRDMEVVLPIDDSVGGWVVMYPPVVHHADNNQCGNQTTYQKLHASSGALRPASLTPCIKGLIVCARSHDLALTHYLHMFPACLHTGPMHTTTPHVLIYLYTKYAYKIYFLTAHHSRNMPIDFFYTVPNAQQCVWVALLRHTGWDIDDLLKMPIGIIFDLIQVIQFEVQHGTNDQAQAWLEECMRYADERGWDLRWFNTMYITWLLLKCQINHIRIMQSHLRTTLSNNNVRYLYITVTSFAKVSELYTAIIQWRHRLYLMRWKRPNSTVLLGLYCTYTFYV
jgi:hypothetical protein